ncbi:GntR family transcriptional regulator [Xanthomonas campestris pv. campestris]|nr:GntR family transcriptional regulator [Xanthomonas campestris pv. campestris]
MYVIKTITAGTGIGSKPASYAARCDKPGTKKDYRSSSCRSHCMYDPAREASRSDKEFVMSEIHSKRAVAYAQVRRALQSGQYPPGQRIDPAKLATEFKISPTPVRFALYRLVGEGLVIDHARFGLQVPLLTEVALRDLYDWMDRLLRMACDIGVASTPHAPGQLEPTTAPADVVKQTWKLFDAIAHATAHWSLHHAVRQANDRLAPVRRAKHGLLDSLEEELAELTLHWQRRDLATLQTALHAYHVRRIQAVPRIVAIMNERINQASSFGD